MRRILHVAQPRDAGVPRVAARLVEDQVARGFDVAVASPAGGELRAAAEAAGARWLAWEAARGPGPATGAETARLRRIVRAVAPDLVHLHSAKAGLAGRLALRGRRPTVFQPHAWSFEAVGGALRRATVGWERFAVRWTDAIVCVSEAERLRATELGIAGRHVVVPNGVDLGSYPPADEEERRASRAALGIGDEPLAVVVGRLSRQKGQDVLLGAWLDVVARVPDARLVLVGDGPERERLEALAPASARFAGQVPDAAAWLAAADVVVVPSRWEGAPLVLLEAMARARSVVATDVAGARECLSGGGGEVVAVGDAAALARAISERLLDRDMAAREGAAGRARVERDYDVRAASAAMSAVYDDVLARR